MFGHISDIKILYYSDFIFFSVSTRKILFYLKLASLCSWSRFHSSHPTALQYTKSIFLTKKVMNMNTKLFIMNILSTQHVCFLSRISQHLIFEFILNN